MRQMTRNNQPPLITHIIYALKAGGLENGLVNIINNTPKNRYRHAIVCLTESDDFARRLTDQSTKVIALHKKEGHDLGLYFRLWKTLFELKPAIVHTRNLASLEMQLVAFFIPGAKRVHGEHGRDINDLDGTNRKYRLLRKLMRLFVQKYITVSRDLYQWLISVIQVKPARVVQIYNGVDTALFQPCEVNELEPVYSGSSAKPLIVGTVGRLAEVKNQRLLVRAIHQLVISEPDMAGRLKAIIVGDGPSLNLLEQEIEKLGLSEVIGLAGDRSDVADLLRTMDIFVLPSLAEGISNTILEAMASGVPVVATDVGGTPELIENRVTGLLVPNNNHTELAKAIRMLIDHPEMRKEMGANGRKRVEKQFSWDRAVDEYLVVYDELLGGRIQ